MTEEPDSGQSSNQMSPSLESASEREISPHSISPQLAGSQLLSFLAGVKVNPLGLSKRLGVAWTA